MDTFYELLPAIVGLTLITGFGLWFWLTKQPDPGSDDWWSIK
jgi:hypothetical protein